jgi:ferritin-like metal-binding protein YciE
MSVKNPEDMFVWMLSDARQREERAKTFLEELHKVAEDKEVEEIIEQRLFLRDKIIGTIDQAFKLMGKQPVTVSSKTHDFLVEELRQGLGKIEFPAGKALFIRFMVNQIMHLQIGEYTTLIAMADMSGHYGVGVLLETCLADNMAFVERGRRLTKSLVEGKMSLMETHV